MTLEEFCDGIGLEEEVSRQALQFEIGEEIWQTYQLLFQRDKEQFFEKLEQEEQKHLFALALYIRMAAAAYEEYRAAGISDEIYFDTFRDVKIWSDVCRRKYGTVGLAEYRWVSLPMERKIYRLGRLQFEPCRLEAELSVCGQKLPVGTRALFVHIPEGEPLDTEKCREAFRKADVFFDASYKVYRCESWLLSPALGELLDADTNIIRFQRMFEPCGVIYPFRQAEERVFGFVSERKEDYPENSSLQKALKAYVRTGRDAGIGIGAILRQTQKEKSCAVSSVDI